MVDSDQSKGRDKGSSSGYGDRRGDRRDSDRDRLVKRVNLPVSLKTLAALDLPLDMIDGSSYLEVVKKCLNDCREVSRANRLSDLTDSIDAAISKCQKLINYGPEELNRKSKKEKDLDDYDLAMLLKKPNFVEELEDLDLSKIKNSHLREKFTAALGKRGQTSAPKKDDWETEYIAYYQKKILKKE